MSTNWLKKLFAIRRPTPPSPIDPGLYHALEEADGRFTRFHLRVERDGTGMLIANAQAAARLTSSGVVIAKGLLEGRAEDEILEQLQEHFQGADERVMRRDIADVDDLIAQVVRPGDTYPVFNLEDAAFSPHAAALIAPLQAAVPLAPPEQLVPVLDRMWEAGIPHVILLAPRSPEPAHLVRAVERAEDLGMIAGVRGLANDLYVGTLLADLQQAGVDHITFPYAANDPEIHDALCGEGDFVSAMEMLMWLEEQQICAVVEIPLVQRALYVLADTVQTVLTMGADNLVFVAYTSLEDDRAREEGVFGPQAMPQVATSVEEVAEDSNARFLWAPPVQRDPGQTLAEQVQQGPRCYGDVAVRVEPDGRVIPARGAYESAGNLLDAPWDAIWEHEVFRDYREHVEAPTRCEVCPGLTICAAVCPREPAGWAQPHEEA